MTMNHDANAPSGLMPGEEGRNPLPATGEMPGEQMPGGAMHDVAPTGDGEMPRGDMHGARDVQRTSRSAASTEPRADAGEMPAGLMSGTASPMDVPAYAAARGFEIPGEWRIVLCPVAK